MKQRPKNLVAMIIIAALAVLLPLSVLISDSNRTDEGNVLGIFKSKSKKKAKKVKKTQKKKTSPKTIPKSSSPSPSSSLPVPQAGPARGEETNKGSELSDLEREITVLYNDKKVIGPDHYNRLKTKLDSLAATSDKAKIAKLREMLATVNPDQVKPTGSTAPQDQKQNCPDDKTPVLTADITDFSKIQKITAPGSPVNDKDRYKGHSFIWTEGQRVPVYVPVDSSLESISYGADNISSPNQYLLNFQVKANCNFTFRFDHVDEPIDSIKAAGPQTPSIADSTKGVTLTQKIEFRAGDLIGYTQGTRQAGNWDFGMYYMKEEGPLSKHDAFGLGRHAVCWVDYYASEKQSKYRKLFEGPKLVCSF